MKTGGLITLTPPAVPPAPVPLLKRPAFRCSRLLTAVLLAALPGTVLAAPTPITSFRAQFDRMDAEGHLILRLSQTALPVDLYGVTLKIWADGVLSRMLLSNVSLDVKVLQKSSVPRVVLIRGKVNVPDELVSKGYATRL